MVFIELTPELIEDLAVRLAVAPMPPGTLTIPEHHDGLPLTRTITSRPRRGNRTDGVPAQKTSFKLCFETDWYLFCYVNYFFSYM
jgi:hypothetical protein